jgi:hypothetical protein
MTRFSVFTMVPALLGLSASVHAGTLLSENFDELTPQLAATSVGAFSTLGGTNVDILGGGLFGSLCAAPESGNCVDMDGTGGLPQGTLQTNTALTLSPGVDYYLSFDLIGSGRGVTTSTTVAFGPYSQTFVLASGDVTSGIVSDELVTVTTSTSANLKFTSNTPGEVGALLDDVLITSGVPEPSTWILSGPALLGVYLLARRRVARAPAARV